ncbi:hypothetical protein G9A89_021240 [Geosiphon pyriformis]|nr:hypothetical protein G9A89_021240 [Geosiphon pyriformis]
MSNSWERVDIYYNVTTQVTGIELAIPLISPAVQIIGDNLKINSVIGGSTTSRKREFTANRHQQPLRKETKNLCNNNFKSGDLNRFKNSRVLSQRFNIPDGIETFKKTLYQYIENCINNYLLENYNISEDFNSQILETYFQELNFNIIQYCEKNYPVKQKFSLSFESETEEGKKKGNKNSELLPIHLKPLPNIYKLQNKKPPQTPSLPLIWFSRIEDFQSPKSPIQQQEPILTSTNLIDYLAKNQSEETKSEQKTEDSKNEKKMASTYITKIPEFTGEDNETSSQEWLDKVSKAEDANGWNAARMLKTIPYFLQGTAGKWFENLEALPENWKAFKTAFLEQFTDNNTFITLSKSVLKYQARTKRICQLETNEYYSNAQILDQFIAGLKDKLIKKVCPHAPEDLATAIQQAKNYEMAMEKANCTKLVNLAIGETSSAAEEKIDQLTKKQLQQPQRYQPPQQHNQNKFGPLSNNQIQNCHYCGILEHWKHDCRKLQQDQQQRNNQCYSQPQQSYYPPPPAQYLPRPQYPNHYYQPALQPIQQQSTHYHTQPSYLTIPEESNFQQTALFEGEAAAPRQNPSNNIISPARIARNANLSDIFPFEFEANELPSLLSNVAVNKQKAITAMYTEAEVEGKPIRLILDSRSAGSIITYQLIQQLQQTVDKPAQTVIITANDIKKTPVGEIDNFLFTIDGITIPVKVLVMDAPQYQAFVGNDWLLKTNANLDWETQELKILYQGQHTIISVMCGTFNKQSKKALVLEFEEEKKMPLTETYMALELTSNWAEETKQEIFEELRRWKKGHLIKRSEKWDNTPCLTCGDMLPEECNWIDVAMKGEVCNQICQYALSISEKVKRGTLFNAAYNSAFNKLYHYSHNAEMIFDLAMTLVNKATKENVCQIKEAEYIEYTMELAEFDYEDKVEVYYQIAKQINIRLCEECIMPCNEQWCPECYTLSIPLPIKDNQYEIEFGIQNEEVPVTFIYLTENQLAITLKYFNNKGQGIKPEKAHKIDAEYDLRYPERNTLILQPKSFTRINLKIAFEISPGIMIKEINIKEGIIDAGYTGDITVMLQNETNKPFKIEHAEKIAQAIYLPLINISGLQLVNQREQLRKSERGTQDFGSTGRFMIPVNIALNTQNESHQILRLPQPITISPFGEYHEIYTCRKPTTTQQIFEANEQICMKHGISIPNIYIPKGMKKVRITFYNLNHHPIILLNNLEIRIIHSKIFQQELPQTVLNFSEIIGHSLPKFNLKPSAENYHISPNNRIKQLIAEHTDIFAKNNNNLGRTDLVQHQIYTEDVKSRRQQAYQVALESHQFIREEIQRMLNNRLIQPSMSS